jgi:dipeptidyl aminopeptidase/acylaminoacyl peptidase
MTATTRNCLLLGWAVVCLAATGCVPQAVWLPDSSGFIYTDALTGGEQILLYDIAKGESRVIAKNTAAFTINPAVSPDGKRVAFARFTEAKDPERGKMREEDKLGVTICDLTGKDVQVSKEFEWALGKDLSINLAPPRDAELYWSPKGDKVLVSARGRTGLYDIKADKLTMVLGKRSPLVFGNTPIRPDGKGFLLFSEDDWDGPRNQQTPGIIFVDWDGKVQAIKLTNFKLDDNRPSEALPLVLPQVHASSWNKDLAEVRWGRKAFRIDTAKLEAKQEKLEGETDKDGRPIQQKFQFPGNGPTVRLVETRAREIEMWEQKEDLGAGEFRVEVLADGHKQPKVLVEKHSGLVQLLPAPNGDYLLIDCIRFRMEAGKKMVPDFGRTLLLLNRKGEVVKKIEQTLLKPEK